ncbi:hypothetical protein BABINDRAFT_159596 [Babjeviella inositovora NRRL Y-12698]|uniref:Small ribosomal subunit protein uS10 domain-containing protein n=1 Tax=Babjeviella inositovora NRRL Y-12698 TaxID=984486 RepID=A0A1E3R175_9ASCO|nr:uncharacterized protein BABINDRAFT_159596 [Babjeviella inositovora NRRL Y-12698]ODQ83147.1 hypothetical protein BABINDRAFT_159596 [Babjeviella inositovora NRRL Y-12698]
MRISASKLKNIKPASVTGGYAPKVIANHDLLAKDLDLSIAADEKDAALASKPVPLAVELTYYKPMKWPVHHNHLTGDITVRSYGIYNVELFSDFILRVGYYLGIPMTGPTPLPLKIESWTTIRGPFIHAKSKDNWERKTRSRLIKCWDCTPEVFELMMSVVEKYGIPNLGVKSQLYVDHSLESIKKDLNMVDSVALKTVSKEEDAVLARVRELLADPAFKRHLDADAERVKTEATQEHKRLESEVDAEVTAQV